MFSNRYIFIYSSVMVIIVALLLSVTATVLQPYQQKNLEVEKMKDILGSAHIKAETAEVPEAYRKYVTREIVIDENGKQISLYSNGQFIEGNIRAFDINIKEQLHSKSKTGKAQFPLYVIDKNGEIFYVIPLLGRGLWGPVWGTIALRDDWVTVAGVTFGHKSETPGLGAEISTAEFQQQFVDKKIFNEKGDFVSVKLVKGGVKNNPSIPEIHGVDAISGGTITCDGTTDMIRTNLENYIPYIQKMKHDGNHQE